jgi:hypothetical protein
MHWALAPLVSFQELEGEGSILFLIFFLIWYMSSFMAEQEKPPSFPRLVNSLCVPVTVVPEKHDTGRGEMSHGRHCTRWGPAAQGPAGVALRGVFVCWWDVELSSDLVVLSMLMCCDRLMKTWGLGEGLIEVQAGNWTRKKV